MLTTIRNHLISSGRHPLFRVWKGPSAIDDSNEEWMEASKAPLCWMQIVGQVVDEGVNVEQLLDDLFPLPNDEYEGVGLIRMDPSHGGLAMGELGIIQDACGIIVKLVELPKNMPMQNNPGRVEGDVDMETTKVDLQIPVAPLVDDISIH